MALSNENKLIKDCKNNCRIAQRKIYEQYGALFFTICLRYSKNTSEAEQLLQDSFLKIFQSIHSYRYKGSFEGWMKRIVINTCLDFFKSKNYISDKKTDYFDTILDLGNFISLNDGLDKISLKEILEQIQALPDTTRNVFNLFVFEGYNHKEISQMLDMSEGTSQWHVNNARKILKSKIDLQLYQVKKKKHETSKVG